ncbi:MAG: hypothetical protein E7570_02205 [Ruminococcaceae bacterium]|nr:hypothetical protein [Oscillospiraceae bacterium]
MENYIKKYRIEQFGDYSGWRYLNTNALEFPKIKMGNDFDESINERIQDFYKEETEKPKTVVDLINFMALLYCSSLDQAKKDIREYIVGLFNAIRYMIIYYNPILYNFFIMNSYEMPIEDKSNYLDVIVSYTYEKFLKLLEGYDKEKNTSFFLYSMNDKILLQIKSDVLEESNWIRIKKDKAYKIISEIKRIENYYLSTNGTIPNDEIIAKEYNKRNSESKKITAVEVGGFRRILQQQKMDSLDGIIDDGDTPIDIPSNEPPIGTDIEVTERVKRIANNFSQMLVLTEFYKHYNNDKRKATPEKYEHFQMFYACDVVKYLKAIPFIQEYLYKSNDKILGCCDKDFIHFIVLLPNIFKLTDVESAAFKKYRDLDSSLFDKKLLDSNISITEVESKDSKNKGKLKLVDEGRIYGAYKYKTRKNLETGEGATVSRVSEHMSNYIKYQEALLKR